MSVFICSQYILYKPNIHTTNIFTSKELIFTQKEKSIGEVDICSFSYI